MTANETIIEAMQRTSQEQAARDAVIIALLTKLLAELEAQGKKK